MDDSNLIFLISQPRSGSTLLQKILGTHSDIYTTSEPWLMLGFLYGLKPGGIYAEFDKATEYVALSKFIRDLPNGGRSRYLSNLRDFSLSLYREYVEKAGREYFLDKTPRYYFVLDELMETFPSAKFIFLRRHPISVLYSIVKTWTKESWYTLSSYRHDLVDGLQISEKYISHPGIYHITYENMVQNPQEEVRGLCKYLGIAYSETMLAYDNTEHWPYGDLSKQLESGAVSQDRLNLWEKDLISYQLWRVLYDYHEWIGPQRMDRLGYGFQQTETALAANCPASDIKVLREATFSLFSFLDNTKDCLYKEQQLNAEISSLVATLETTRKNASAELMAWKENASVINYQLLRERIRQIGRRIIK